MKRILFTVVVTACFLNWAYYEIAVNANIGKVKRMHQIELIENGE